MDDSLVSIPVTCPTCGNPHFTDVPAVVLKVAIDQWNNLRLHGRCHAVSWDASAAEVEAIRTYLRDHAVGQLRA